MRILLTNDDGFGAEGLVALERALGSDNELWVFAPDRERSGVSHALTMGSPGKVRELGPRRFTCSGTPADCVILAMLGAIGCKPDAVVSGINRGPNLGTDIVYSGTCAAAREAVLAGVPGVAVSCVGRERNLRYGAAASFVARHLAELVSSCTGEAFINVNAPDSDEESLPGMWCSPCARVYENGLRSFEAPDGYSYHFLLGSDSASRGAEESDYRVVASGKVAVSPILVQPQSPAGFLSGQEFR
jgi:5''/3''-nucleotidase SurE